MSSETGSSIYYIEEQIQTLLDEKRTLYNTIKDDDEQIRIITAQITELTSKKKLTTAKYQIEELCIRINFF